MGNLKDGLGSRKTIRQYVARGQEGADGPKDMCDAGDGVSGWLEGSVAATREPALDKGYSRGIKEQML